MIYAIAFILLHGCNAALAALFAPPHPVLGRYEVCADPSPIERLVDAGRLDGIRFTAPEPLDPLDAFGSAGAYDRNKVARLYGGLRPRVARGWKQTGDRFESTTLISPHPDAALEHLVSGTLAIRWII